MNWGRCNRRLDQNMLAWEAFSALSDDDMKEPADAVLVVEIDATVLRSDAFIITASGLFGSPSRDAPENGRYHAYHLWSGSAGMVFASRTGQH